MSVQSFAQDSISHASRFNDNAPITFKQHRMDVRMRRKHRVKFLGRPKGDIPGKSKQLIVQQRQGIRFG